MKFSVIIPSYRQARFIRDTIESLLAQNRADLEILVFDGGSDDGTVDILESYGNNIEYVSRPDGGQTDAINQGLRRARGEVLAYLNSDDVYFPGALDCVERHFDAHPDSLAVYGAAWHLYEDGSKMKRYPTEPWDYRRLLETCYLCQPAVFWRRELMERCGTFDDRLNWAMDYEYWLRAGRSARFDYLEDAVLAGSRLHEGTKTLSQRVRVHEEILNVVMRHASEPPVKWLLALARVIVEDVRIPAAGGSVPEDLKSAWLVETVLERADALGIPFTAELAEGLKGCL
ncbi:MAG: glycosyltransferase [Chthoniobacteraceae bacterium]